MKAKACIIARVAENSHTYCTSYVHTNQDRIKGVEDYRYFSNCKPFFSEKKWGLKKSKKGPHFCRPNLWLLRQLFLLRPKAQCL